MFFNTHELAKGEWFLEFVSRKTVYDICRLQTGDCRPQTADCRLQTADCRPQIADCKLKDTKNLSSVAADPKVSPNWSLETMTCHSSHCFSIVWG